VRGFWPRPTATKDAKLQVALWLEAAQIEEARETRAGGTEQAVDLLSQDPGQQRRPDRTGAARLAQADRAACPRATLTNVWRSSSARPSWNHRRPCAGPCWAKPPNWPARAASSIARSACGKSAWPPMPMIARPWRAPSKFSKAPSAGKSWWWPWPDGPAPMCRGSSGAPISCAHGRDRARPAQESGQAPSRR
jgi:hypothetical protein